MPARQKRLVIPLDDTASEGLSLLSEWTGVGEATLAKRLLSAVLMVIGNAIDSAGDLGEDESHEEWKAGLDADKVKRDAILAELDSRLSPESLANRDAEDLRRRLKA
jgi:hypothetical protein